MASSVTPSIRLISAPSVAERVQIETLPLIRADLRWSALNAMMLPGVQGATVSAGRTASS
jgi:hypothetical protein